MHRYHDNRRIRYVHNMQVNNSGRYLNPSDINLPPGYTIEVFAQGLNSPTSILFTPEGKVFLADSGYVFGNPSLYQLINGQFELIADHFNVPLTGINYLNGDIYVSHRGMITVIHGDGTREDILSGLPSDGDYSNSRVAFGADGKMYFGQGTATNSGVVGEDNLWVRDHPYFHDRPGSYIILNGQNFRSKNIFTSIRTEEIYTGAFAPYGEPNIPFEVRKGVTRASGCILRANLDGSDLELVAWGLRSPSYVKFDEGGRLFASNDGCDLRGSRPIANAPDEFQLINQGKWYGWPDYCGGEPVNTPRFQPEGGRLPEFLLVNHPDTPPKPFASFPPNATIIGFEFNYNKEFGNYGDTYIAEFGPIWPLNMKSSLPYSGSGHRVSKIDMNTGGVTTFVNNKSGFPSFMTGEGGISRPSDIAFGPDGAMYIVDMGTNSTSDPNLFLPNTGVIWKVRKS